MKKDLCSINRDLKKIIFKENFQGNGNEEVQKWSVKYPVETQRLADCYDRV